MKKFLKVFGIIAVVICLTVSIVACDKGSDKDSVKVIAVSGSEYASAEDALKGYVKEELASSWVDNYDGEVYDVVIAEYVSKESKGAVSGDTIKLSNEQKTGFVSAEKFAVKVKIASAPDEGEKAVFSEVTQTIYVLKYGEKYKFMVSTPEVGERVTNSYFKMIADASKYENCTINQIYKEYENEKEIDFEGYEFKFTAEESYQVTYYDKTRYENRTPGRDENSGDRRRYVVKNGEGIAEVYNHYDKNNEEVWTVDAFDSEVITTVKAYNKEMIEEMFSISNSAALFTKTANGLEMQINESREFEEDNESYESVTVYRLTVTEDKVTGLYTSVTTTWTEEKDGETNVDIEFFEVDAKITDFGSTTVSVPTEVTEALKHVVED